MAKYTRDPNAPSAEDKALDRFAQMMIEKISTIEKDWQKPWFSDGTLAMPRNLSGRRYNGMNSLMLLLHCEKEGYKMPFFCTFDRVAKLNFDKGKDKEDLPQVHVNKGEKSFPVFITTYTVIDKDTKAKIPYEDYKKLSKEDREQYNVYPKTQVYNVFNVDQTNIAQARPELYAKLQEQVAIKQPLQAAEAYTNPVLDAMVENNAWICPIRPEHQDKAFYSISKDAITIPEKSQFIDGQSYYGTMLHEMTHSTGAEPRLNRLKACQFGDDAYAREELVAELGSALICQQNGISKHIKDDSAAYLKTWLESLQESPEFIKSTLQDVKKATSVISRRMEDIQVQLDNGQKIEPYTQADAAIDPTLAPDEAPFKGKKEDGGQSVTEEAAMAVPGKKPVMREVDVMGLFNALKRDGEAKLSDHYIDEKPEQDEQQGNEQDEEQDNHRGFRR